MSVPALAVAGLTKRFGKIAVADGISLSLAAGERVALIGPNGAGKSSFLDLVAGRLAPDAGAIYIAGRDVTFESEVARARLGLARSFQTRPLLRGMTAGEHLSIAILSREGRLADMLARVDHQENARAEALAGLDRLGLADAVDTPVETLAYGEQRLVEIALVLARRPGLLLLDEPSAGLSRAEAGRLLQVLRELPAPLTIVMIEHDMDMVFGFAERIAVLAEGRLIRVAPPLQIAADPEIRALYLGRLADGR